MRSDEPTLDPAPPGDGNDPPPARLSVPAPGVVWKVAVGALALAVVGAVVVWFVGRPSETTVAEKEVPLITADTSPSKRVPEEPGGLDIPNQDKLVYGIIDPDAEPVVVERLLPPPEEPIAIAPLPTQPREEALADIAPAAGTDADTVGGEAPAAPLPVAPPSAADPGAAVPAEPAEEAVVATTVEPPSAGRWRIQVGAFKSRVQAEDEWQRLTKKAGPLLAGLEPRIESVDLGADKGIFHRLQLASFADRAASEAMCAKLAALGIGCLVVKP
jgi:cell division protein FtsN